MTSWCDQNGYVWVDDVLIVRLSVVPNPNDQLHPSRVTARLGCHSVTLTATLGTLIHEVYLGKVRLAKWFTTMAPKVKAKIIKDVTQLVLARRTRMCNFLEYKGHQVTPSIRSRN